jgi:hypothetical protein
VAGTGIAYADFLYGDPQTAMLSNLFDVNQKWYWLDFFAQDDVKLTPRLTLNLGVRYDFASPVWEGNNHLANFDPAGSGSIIPASNGSLENRSLVQPQKLDFSPRLGVGLPAYGAHCHTRGLRYLLRSFRSCRQRKSACAESSELHQQQYLAIFEGVAAGVSTG